MKKLVIFFSLLLAVVLSFNLKIQAATSDVMYITTSFGEDASKEINVNYHAKVNGTVVEYTVSSDTSYSSKKTVTPVSTTWSYQNDPSYTPFEERFVCKANLTNLNPETEYRYRIKTPSGSYSSDYYFKTAYGRGTTTFLFVTDSQAGVNDYTYFNSLIAKAKELKPDTSFMVHTGDITDRGGQPEQWNGFYGKSTNLSMMPIASAPGNHEYYLTSAGSYVNAEVYNQFFNNPQNGPASRKNSSYYFTYNNILFIMLDTITTDTLVEQKEWFRSVVSNNMNRVIIVGMHIGPFTGGGAYADSGKNVFRQWSPLFEEFNVDLVLSGHEHNYAPSKTIYQQKISTNGLGTNYLVGPAAGTKLGGHNLDVLFTGSLKLRDLFIDDQIGAAINRNKAGVIIKAGGNELELTYFDFNGNIIHSYNIAAKRPSSIQELSHDDFMDSVELVHDEANGTAKVTWSADAYGNVKTIEVINGAATNKTFISTPLFVEQTLGNVYEGNEYNVTVNVVFKDDQTLTKTLVLDLKDDEEVPADNDKDDKKKGCLSGANIVTIFGMISTLSAFAFVLRRRK